MTQTAEKIRKNNRTYFISTIVTFLLFIYVWHWYEIFCCYSMKRHEHYMTVVSVSLEKVLH